MLFALAAACWHSRETPIGAGCNASPHILSGRAMASSPAPRVLRGGGTKSYPLTLPKNIKEAGEGEVLGEHCPLPFSASFTPFITVAVCPAGLFRSQTATARVTVACGLPSHEAGARGRWSDCHRVTVTFLLRPFLHTASISCL